MKKFILIFFVLLHYSFANAQTYIYHPFQYSNAIWRFQWAYGPCGNNLNIWTIDYQYRVKGDTVISGKTYAKLYKDSHDNGCSGGGTSFATSYSGGIRNDTMNKRIYFFNVNLSTETLLYNFNLNVGDSTLFCNGIITTIDSVLVGSNFRKRFITNYQDKIIEGIGTVAYNGYSDLIQPYCGLTLSPNEGFVCYEDSIDVYRPGYAPCTQITNVAQLTHFKGEINLTPNPIYDEGLILYNNSNSDLMRDLYFYDSKGLLVKNQLNIMSDKFKIQKAELNKGFYFVKIMTKNNMLFVTKFIVN